MNTISLFWEVNKDYNFASGYFDSHHIWEYGSQLCPFDVPFDVPNWF